MSTHQLLVLVLIQLVILLLPSIGLAKLFEKAGVPGWKAWVPFYNTWIMMELAHRPKHWVFWQLIPVVGWFISLGIFVEFVKTFGKYRLWEHTMASLLPLIYFPLIGFDPKVKFLGPDQVRKHKKGTAREWIDAGVFAIVAATLIRTFVFEAYTIPTGSMEKTLLINDFLFVSKFSYGPRIPNTPLSIPFVHNTMPITNTNSYVEWIKIPYTRWFASPVKRGDVVVFNFPAGDTVINLPEFQSQNTYYDEARRRGNGNLDSGRQLVLGDPDTYGPFWIPAKGKSLTLTAENYPMYERAIRVYEGNSLEMKDGKFILNGQPATQYTFKLNYYWMMGDNRHGSQDSRYWGFVPEDHVVGEAWLIWMSWNKGVRWGRLFKKIR
jgi:signal peptidase I